MEKTNVSILRATLLSISFIILFISVFSASSAAASSAAASSAEDFKTDVVKKDKRPIISVTHPHRVAEGQLVMLDASKSFDPDGGSIKFNWKKVSPDGLNIHISDDNSPIATFIAPEAKMNIPVSLGLSVEDDTGSKNAAVFHITISKKQINTQKDQIDNPRSDLQDSTSDGRERKAQDSSVTTEPRMSDRRDNSPKVDDKKIMVNAGEDMTVTNGTLVKLHGSISSNFDSGKIKLSWTQKKGPVVELSSNKIFDPVFKAPNVQRNEEIQFDLRTSDQNGLSASDSVNIVVQPTSGNKQDNGQSISSFKSNQSEANANSSIVGITAADATPPTVTSTTPASGATGVPITSVINAKFSEAVKSSTVTTSSFILKNNAGTGIRGTISYISPDGKSATFRPSSSLTASTSYTATLSPTSTTRIQDLAGNNMATKSWSFATTADGTRPTVISTTPASGATGVPITSVITAIFSEAVKSSTVTTSSFILKNSAGTGIPGTISYISPDGKSATFRPSSSLTPSTSYTATLSPTSTTRIQDLAGNNMATKSWSFTAASASPASKTGLYVPLFTYPTSSTWSTLVTTKNNHPNLPILVTINPNSGVGSSVDGNFVNGINQLKSAGIIVIGYIYTDYGQRSTAVIQDEINKYKSWYGVNGIFFDEMSTSTGKESYYSSLNSYVKSSGMTFTMGNPGTDTKSSYIGTVDNMIIYENQGLPSIDSLKGWHLSYNKKNFSIIPYGVSTLSTQFINDAKNYVGYIYVTNDVLPNPWDSLPSYLSTLASSLDQ